MVYNSEVSISTEALKRHSKRLLKEMKLNNPHFKLTEAQNLLAKIFGLNNWHEMSETLHKNKEFREKEKKAQKQFLFDCEIGHYIKYIEDSEYSDFLFDISEGINIAANNGKLQNIKYMIEEYLPKNPQINISTSAKQSCFLRACRKGHIGIVDYLMEKEWVIDNEEYSHIFKAVFREACEQGHFDLIQYFLDYSSLKHKFNNEEIINRGFVRSTFGISFEGCSGNEHSKIIHYLLTSDALPIKADIHTQEDKALSSCDLELDLVKYLLTSPDLKEHANIYAQHGKIFEHFCHVARLINYTEVVDYLINEYQIEQTPEIMQSLIKYKFV